MILSGMETRVYEVSDILYSARYSLPADRTRILPMWVIPVMPALLILGSISMAVPKVSVPSDWVMG